MSRIGGAPTTAGRELAARAARREAEAQAEADRLAREAAREAQRPAQPQPAPAPPPVAPTPPPAPKLPVFVELVRQFAELHDGVEGAINDMPDREVDALYDLARGLLDVVDPVMRARHDARRAHDEAEESA